MPSRRRRHLHPLQERAQSLAEYSLLLGLIFVVVAATVPFVGSAVNNLYAGMRGFFGG